MPPVSAAAPPALTAALATALAVGGGAALGALLRWALGLALNARFPLLPPGTLAANLLGALLAGAALARLGAPDAPAPAWWPFAVAGVLGGLTTFSALSAEAVGLWRQHRRGWAAATVLANAGGSLALAALGHAAAVAASAAVR